MNSANHTHAVYLVHESRSIPRTTFDAPGAYQISPDFIPRVGETVFHPEFSGITVTDVTHHYLQRIGDDGMEYIHHQIEITVA